MYFKLSNKNPYRDLLKFVNIISRSDISDKERVQNYRALYKLLKDDLKENSLYLNSSPAFSNRCNHWNYVEDNSITDVVNLKNPWLYFKRQFENAVNASYNSSYQEVATLVSKELAWFYATKYRSDWIFSP